MLPFSLFSRDVIKYGFLCEEESDTKCIVLRGGGQTRSSILSLFLQIFHLII